jgi:DNA polymerase-1
MERGEAAEFIRKYFEEYAGVQRYVESTKQLAYQQGYVSTILGRRRYLPDIHSANRQVRAAAERMAINMPVQGTAADIIKVAMIRLYDRMRQAKLRSRMLLQVHDELIFEAPAEELDALRSLILEIMPHAIELSVPLRVDVKTGRNWGELE